MNVESSMQLVFTAEEISKQGLQLRWTSQLAPNHFINGGFKLSWEIKQHDGKLREMKEPNKDHAGEWKFEKVEPSLDKKLNLVGFINLVSDFRGNSRKEYEVWTTLLKHKEKG